MTRKRSLSKGLFGMAPKIVEAALEELTPEQANKISANQAQKIMEAAISCAGTIGRILEEGPAAMTSETPTPTPTPRGESRSG